MIYTVFLNCKQLVWGLNKYKNKLFASRNTPLCYLCHLRYMCNCTLQNHLCLIVAFVIFIKSIHILSTMFLIDNLLNISKLQIACFYHTYFKNYRLLNTMTPNKMLMKESTFSL